MADQVLPREHVKERAARAFADFDYRNKKLLIVIPDNTRTAPIGLFFRIFYELVAGSVKKLDYLVALGTHPLLNDDERLKRVGISRGEREEKYKNVEIFNHRWDKRETFVRIGSIRDDEMKELTGGLLDKGVEITINRLIFDYDYVVILGPVFPHEIAGFSGSNKYLFPGICGWEFIDVTHWIAALQTNLKTIGIRDTPARRLIDRASRFVPVPLIYFNLVVDKEGLKGLFIGRDGDAWSEAVEMSSRLNIRHVDRPLEKVLSIPSLKYDDFWTGAKAVYKIEPAVADGGELVVYAPHIREFSITHGQVIRRAGFHIVDYFLRHMDDYSQFPKAVLAYSALVKGAGKLKEGREEPRINVVLASGISRERCEELNLQYRDPRTIDVQEWEGEGSGKVMVIHNSGEVLYRVRK